MVGSKVTITNLNLSLSRVTLLRIISCDPGVWGHDSFNTSKTNKLSINFPDGSWQSSGVFPD